MTVAEPGKTSDESVTETNPPPALTLKAKILLVTFGLAGGVLALALTLQFLPGGIRGTEFSSIEDVRRAMLRTDDAPDASQGSSETGPVSLRGIVTPHERNDIIYTLRPNLDLRFVRARVVTNSCGMRSPERPVAKAPGTYRIALLGDSFAFGWGVEQEQSFAQILENNLNKMAGESRKVEVLNFGVPGYSTFQEVALFEDRALDFQPDAVLVYFVQNDFGMPFFVRDLNAKGGSGILSSLEFVKIGKRLLQPQDMDRQIREMGLDPNSAILRLVQITKARGIKLLIALNPHKNWRRDLQNLWALKNEKDFINLIALRDPIMRTINNRKIDPVDLTLSYDPHPSPLRHQILGDLLTPYFMGEVS